MKLFVAKLNRDVQDEHLVELFSQYGEVAYARVVTDRDTGQSKCFGFVQMREKSSAQAALEALNGKEFMRFPMVVKEAEERAPRPGAPAAKTGGNASSESRDFSRRPGEQRPSRPEGEIPNDPIAVRPAPKKKTPNKRQERDMWADGPRQPKLKGGGRPKYNDWLGGLDDE